MTTEVKEIDQKIKQKQIQVQKLETKPRKVINILIEFVFENKKKIFLRKYIKFPLQNELFKYGIKITNIDKEIFQGGEIISFKFSPSNSNESLSRFTKKKFSIGELNPDESKEIFVDEISTFYEGQMWAQCRIESIDKNQDIQVHRRISGRVEEHSKNSWGEPFFIQSKNELQRDLTNILIFILTLLTALDAIFGLKKILVILLKPVSWLLIAVGSLIGRL